MDVHGGFVKSHFGFACRCIPPYISYKFYDESVHEACGSQHAAKLSFDDTHVVLLGIKDKEKLKEYLRGPGLEIEVHDRDRDLSQKRNLPTIFGSHQDDDMISKASLITGKFIYQRTLLHCSGEKRNPTPNSNHEEMKSLN